MTTVGYGDSVPKSALGYVVGTLCAFAGIIILALPIAVVATNFNDFYDKNQETGGQKKAGKETHFIQTNGKGQSCTNVWRGQKYSKTNK